MRKRFGVTMLGAATAVAFLHCGGGDDSTGAQPMSDAGSDVSIPTDSGPIIDAGPVDSGPPIVTVNGTLLGRAGDDGPLASRDVVIVDANGVVTKVASDANGKFGAAGVQTPYDIGIPYVPLDAAAASSPHYYAGISRPDPTVHGSDYNTATSPTEPAQSTTFSYTATICSGCNSVVVGPDSQSGGITGTGVSAVITQSYSWSGSATHSVPLHIYVTDASHAFTYSADFPSTALVAGGTTNLGTPTLAAITNGKINITVAPPTGYMPDETNIRPTTGDGASIPTSFFSGVATGVANYPKIAGVTIDIDTTANLANGATTYQTITYAEATAPTTLTLALAAAPIELLPADHATAVDNTQSMTWTPYAPANLYQIVIKAANGTAYLIYTSGTSLPLAALAKAGVPLSSGTVYSWEVYGDADYVSMDDVASAHPSLLPSNLQGDGDAVAQTFTTQ